MTMSRSSAVTLGATAMIALVVVATFTTRIKLAGTLSWGPFTVALTFLVTMLITRLAGRREAVLIGVAGAVVLSAALALAGSPGPSLLAAFIAFSLDQAICSLVLDLLREHDPYLAALGAGVAAGAVNGALFQIIAYSGTDRPWVSGMLTDAGIKVAIAFVLALGFRILPTLSVTGMERGRRHG
jgi:uncharacterized PurR-regulated membrane protein YhhQ (DUF165 family)